MSGDRLEVSVSFDERCGYFGSHPELRSPVVALSLGGLRRKIEIAMLPDDVEVRLMLDGLAERERTAAAPLRAAARPLTDPPLVLLQVREHLAGERHRGLLAAVEDDAKGLLFDVVPDRVALGGLLAARVGDGAGQRFHVLPRPVGQDVLLRALADHVDVLHDASSGHLGPSGGEGHGAPEDRAPAPDRPVPQSLSCGNAALRSLAKGSDFARSRTLPKGVVAFVASELLAELATIDATLRGGSA